jgi:HK97 gp10 family phage protein
MIQIELSSNANEVVARLGRLHPLISKAIIKALNLSALVVKTAAKTLSPVRTGNLRASIGSRVEGLRQEAYVGSNVEYAEYQEYGTKYMAAQPYLRPALEQNIDNVRDFFVREINLAIERV